MFSKFARVQRSTLLLGIVALLFSGLVLPSFVYASTNTDTIGSAAFTSTFYVFVLSPITPTGSGTLQSIGVNLANTGGGNVEVAIYSDVGGAPGSLIAQSTSTPLNSLSGWQDVPISSGPTVNAGTPYWIGLIFDSMVRTAFYVTGGTTYLSLANYGPWPTSYPLSNPRTYTVNMRITYAATGPTPFLFNVKGTAIQVVVTLMYSWAGSGAPPQGAISIAAPSGNPTLTESAAVVYDRTSISVAGSGNTYILIHRATFPLIAPGSAQVWTAYISLAGVTSYSVIIEVS